MLDMIIRDTRDYLRANRDEVGEGSRSLPQVPDQEGDKRSEASDEAEEEGQGLDPSELVEMELDTDG